MASPVLEIPVPIAAEPEHQHHFHFNLGQMFGLIFLGLRAYQATQGPGNSAISVLSVANSTSLLQGLMTIFPPNPADFPPAS